MLFRSCGVKGYPLKIVTSDAFSREKRDHMAALGADLTLVETSDAQLQSELLIMATHVGNVQGVKNLEAMPPVQQLWEENGNGLLRAVISFAIQLDTSEK